MDEAVADVVERELGERPVRTDRIDEGSKHGTYLVRLDGTEYVLQLAGEADDREDALARGLGWYVALADSPVPVPGVVTDRVRRTGGLQYAIVERLPGETANLEVSPERTRDAGRHLAAIHGARRFDRAGWIRFEGETPAVTPFEEGSPAARLRRKLPEHARTLREEGMEAAAEAVEAAVDRFGDEFPTGFDPVLCHDDFSPDNVLYDGPEVVGVIDFDRSYAGHHQRDLAAAATAFWMHDPGAEWDPRGTFYAGYREVADPGEDFAANEPLYRAETLVRGVAGLCDVTGLSAYEREFYGERIAAALERI